MPELLARSSPRGRLTLATVTLGSGVALLDGTVVNVAVKWIGVDLHASLAQVQWVVTGYLLSLAALILVGGSLGDRIGRRRVYTLGVAGFGVLSGLCALAQTPTQLIVLRVFQGVFAALLTPGSLAILQSSFRPEDRAWAIGRWAGVSGIAAALGPVVGGYLIDHGGWRWIFVLNLPICALVLWLARFVPESRDESRAGRFDIAGAAAGVALLGAATYASTSWRTLPGSVSAVVLAVAAASAYAFVRLERRPGSMVDLGLFASRVFSAANGMTFLVYGALGAGQFLLALQLQVTSGYGPVEAGVASLPIVLAMLLLSSRFAVISQHTGPRIWMSVGPVVCAVGYLLLAGVGADAPYWSRVFPGISIFAFGLSMLVAPLTAAVLAAAPDRQAGLASGINNAVARTGSLIAVAAIPALVGLAGADYHRPGSLTAGYQRGQVVCALLLLIGGVVSWFGLREHGVRQTLTTMTGDS
ncbi:MFS transporter [Nocardioides terrisoli]|uniref:MFS transporter n=1 Tax=Nocardioides terrisoli TaxID=3388267 RepID=UPI00287B817E|nr:MFS transporter [Nocardioides marmorisolisilvae]